MTRIASKPFLGMLQIVYRLNLQRNGFTDWCYFASPRPQPNRLQSLHY
jgi:hypothetical protein